MHSVDIIHRDLKPENMFFHNGQVKLIDLGSSDDLSDTDMRRQFQRKEASRPFHEYFVGTSQYMGPECVHNKPTTKASDIWSLACILFQLHVGFPPFRGGSDYLIFQLSNEALFSPKLDEIPENILPF